MNQIEQTLPTQDTDMRWEQIDSYPFKSGRSQIYGYILAYKDRDEFLGSIEAFDGHFEYWCDFGTETDYSFYLYIHKLADRQDTLKRRFDHATGEQVFPLDETRLVGEIDLKQELPDVCRAVVSIPKTCSRIQDKHQIHRLVQSVWGRLTKSCKQALDAAVPTSNDPPITSEESKYKRELLKKLKQYFNNEEDLRTLYLDLGWTYGQFESGGIDTQARALVEKCFNETKQNKLANFMAQYRPKLKLPKSP